MTGRLVGKEGAHLAASFLSAHPPFPFPPLTSFLQQPLSAGLAAAAAAAAIFDSPISGVLYRPPIAIPYSNLAGTDVRGIAGYGLLDVCILRNDDVMCIFSAGLNLA